MAEIFPFHAYRYSQARVDLSKVLTQPYDKITAEMQERYSAMDPYNLVTIEKGMSYPGDTPENNVYTRAARALGEWIERGVLVRDSAPAIYVYFQDYQAPQTRKRKTRKGFIALGRVEDYAARVVFPHEHTLAGPKADRLELLRHTRAHTGQLFMLYEDPERRVDALLEQVSRVPPPVKVRDEYGVVHRLWPVVVTEAIQRFQLEMAEKKLVIADGHHRYETALAYRDERRAALTTPDLNAPHEKVTMTFFNTHAEGITILPAHRVVSNLRSFQIERFREQLEPYFDVSSFRSSGKTRRVARYGEFLKELTGGGRRAIGLYAGGRVFHLLRLKPDADLAQLLPDVSAAQRELDVVLLHRLVLEKGLGITAEAIVRQEHISYEREMDAAVAAVDRGQAQLCCLLNPVRVEQVLKIALAGEVLPQKSTDFYPKLLSGLTIYRMEP